MRHVVVGIALSLLAFESANAGPLNVDDIPDRPRPMRPSRSHSDAQAAIARGDLPPELIPKRYLKNARIVRGRRYYDADGNVYRWREAHLAAAQCEESTRMVAESDRHAVLASSWSYVASATWWTGLGALAYVPMYNHAVKSGQNWVGAVGAYNASDCGEYSNQVR